MRTLFLFLALTVAAYGRPPLRIPWSQSPDAFAGDSVRVKLTTGTTLRGYWTSVKPDSFTMKVEHTSNRHAVGKGLQTLPRDSIAEVSSGVRRTRGRRWGTGIGIQALAPLGVSASGQRERVGASHLGRNRRLLPGQKS